MILGRVYLHDSFSNMTTTAGSVESQHFEQCCHRSDTVTVWNCTKFKINREFVYLLIIIGHLNSGAFIIQSWQQKEILRRPFPEEWHHQTLSTVRWINVQRGISVELFCLTLQQAQNLLSCHLLAKKIPGYKHISILAVESPDMEPSPNCWSHCRICLSTGHSVSRNISQRSAYTCDENPRQLSL